MNASPVSPSMQGAQRKLDKSSNMALEHIWLSRNKGITAEELWTFLNRALPSDNHLSKASVIDILNTIIGKGLIHFAKRPSQGSYLRVYYPSANWGNPIKGGLQILT